MEVEPWPNSLGKKNDSGNMMGTYWELFKTRKIPSPPPFQTPKGKNHV
jgi:hypothetical protein